MSIYHTYRHKEESALPFGNIGIGGLLLILVVVLIMFGPSKLPELGRAFGRTLSEFKSSTRGLMSDDKDAESKPEDTKKS